MEASRFALGYDPAPGVYDEAIAADGTLRTTWAGAARALGVLAPAELAERQRRIDRLVDAEGAGHLVHDLAAAAVTTPTSDAAPWRLDPIPLVIDGTDFETLAGAARQRMRVLDAFLRDVYGPRDLVRDRVVPAEVLFGIPALNTSARRREPRQWLVHCAMDVVRTATGEWRVVADLVDTPFGLGWMLLHRSVLTRALPDAARTAAVAPVASAAALLRAALAACAPDDVPAARTVVLAPDPGHPDYVESSYLALQMGFHLAEPDDLVVRRNRVWLRALEALEPVDVILRRVPDDDLDPLETTSRGGSGVAAVAWAARRGGASIANGVGVGVAEAREITELLDDVARATIGEALRVGPLRAGEVLATAPSSAGGSSPVISPARVVVRVHAIAGPSGIDVVPGGLARVLGPGDDVRSPSRGLVKDVWVVGSSAPRIRVRAVSRAQIDLRGSVTTRAAQALFWMGRAAERAECEARALRWVEAQADQDPGLFDELPGWARGAHALLRSARGVVPVDDGGPPGVRVEHELRSTAVDLAARVAAIVHEAQSVREYLSLATGRLLGRLARERETLVADEVSGEALDAILTDLAALSGLWAESTVRGPSWRFLDVGRRVERGLLVLGSVEATLGPAVDAVELQPLAEAALAVNESLVAYRRRHRSDVDLGSVLDLLVHDDSNPRGLAYQLDRLREDLASLRWPAGVDLVHQAAIGALTTADPSVVDGRRFGVDALVVAARAPLLAIAQGVVDRWFAVPVNPTEVRGR